MAIPAAPGEGNGRGTIPSLEFLWARQPPTPVCWGLRAAHTLWAGWWDCASAPMGGDWISFPHRDGDQIFQNNTQVAGSLGSIYMYVRGWENVLWILGLLGFFSARPFIPGFPHSLLAEPSPKPRLRTKLGQSEGWLEEVQADAGVDEFDAGRPLVGEWAGTSRLALKMLRHKYNIVHIYLLHQQTFIDWLLASHGVWH